MMSAICVVDPECRAKLRRIRRASGRLQLNRRDVRPSVTPDSRIIIVIYRIDCLSWQPPNVLARPIGLDGARAASGGWGGWGGRRQHNDSQPKAH
jgi:hypothetical protein